MTATASADKNRYHHGNLRNALIVAAAELIQEKGSTEFSMVEASRRAGVSNAAPYRHFRDSTTLIAPNKNNADPLKKNSTWPKSTIPRPKSR